MANATRRALVGLAVLCASAPAFVRAADVARAADNAPDLALEVQAPATAQVGTEMSYAITVHNVGTAAATGPVSLVFTLFSATDPVIDSVVGTGWTCTTTFANKTCAHAGPIAIGASLPVLTATTHFPTDGADLEIFGQLDPVAGDDNADNDSIDFTTTVDSPVDFSVALSPLSQNAASGAPVSFTADVQNIGTVAATGSVSVQTFGLGLTDLAAAGTDWSCSGAFLTCTHSGSVSAGQHLPPLAFTATVGSDSLVELDSQVIHPDDHNTANDFATASITVTDAPDLTLTLELDGPILPNQPASYVATVENVGGSETTDEIVLGFDGLVGTTGVGADWTCDTFTSHIRCATPGPLAAGTSLPPITFSGAFSASPVAVHARVSTGGDGHPDNDEVDLTTPVAAPDLAISADDHGATAVVGSPFEYDVTSQNVGPNPTTGPVAVSYGMFGTAATVTASGPGWSCDNATRTCTNSDIFAAGATLPVLAVHLDVGVTSAGVLDASFFVDAEGDLDPSNDHVDLTTAVTAPVDLAPTIDSAAAPTAFGESGTYAVEVHNLGTAASAGEIRVSIAGASLAITDAQGPGWQCTVAVPTECTRSDSVPGGGAAPAITVTATVTQFSQPVTTLFVSSENDSDGRGDDNDVSLDTNVTSPVDLATTVTDHGATFIAGHTGNYDVSITNVGTATQTDTTSVHLSPGSSGVPTLTQALGAATISNAFGTGWDCGPAPSGGWTCTNTNALGAGASFPDITVVIDVPTDTQTSLSVLTKADADGNLANNSAFETTPIQATADLVIAAADAGTFYTVGQPAVATVSVKNVHAVAAEGTVTVTISTWDGVTDAVASGTDWNCAPLDEADIECTHPGPVAGNTALSDITVTGTAVPTFDGTATLFAQVANQSDGDTSNNFASLVTEVDAPVDLTLQLDGPDTWKLSQPVTLSAIVHNGGTVTDHGQISIAFDVSAFSAIDISAGGTGWSCAAEGAGFQQLCNYDGLLAPGGDLPGLDLTLTPNLVGDVAVSAAVASKSDGRLDNNIVTKTIWVTGTPTSTTSSTYVPTSTTSTTAGHSTTSTSTTTAPTTSTTVAESTTTTTIEDSSTTTTTASSTTTSSTSSSSSSSTSTTTAPSSTTTTTPDDSSSTTSTTVSENGSTAPTSTSSTTTIPALTNTTIKISEEAVGSGGGSGSGNLPFTGSSSGGLAWFAFGTIALGLGLAVTRSLRRR